MPGFTVRPSPKWSTHEGKFEQQEAASIAQGASHRRSSVGAVKYVQKMIKITDAAIARAMFTQPSFRNKRFIDEGLDAKKPPRLGAATSVMIGGRYWTRTSDLYDVNVAL